MPAADRPSAPTRQSFARFVPVSTRWSDNDVYGHINNAAYYAFFDAAVNGLLVEAGVLDPAASQTIGLVVENSCAYFSSLAFPDVLEVGVAVERLGQSSVTYHLGVFKRDASIAAAAGRFTHVYVDRTDRRPRPVPAAHRAVLDGLILAPAPLRKLPRAGPFAP